MRWPPLLLALLCALAVGPVAEAGATGVDGGALRLKLSETLAKRFKQGGVRLAGLNPAKAGRAGVTLPVSGGQLESAGGTGYLFLDGGFRLRGGKRAVALRQLVFNMTKHTLRAKVDGSTIEVATLAPQRAAVNGFDLDLALRNVKLTGRAASVFNRKLGLPGFFKGGRSLGSVSAMAHFANFTVHGGEITFTIDGGFEQKLESVEVGLFASGSASLVGSSPAALSVPVEGQVARDFSSGVLGGEGGLSLVQPNEPITHAIGFLNTGIAFDSHDVFGLANVQRPDPSQSPLHFSGPIGTLAFASAAAQADPETGEISAPPMPVSLHANLASLLNELFGAARGQPSLFAAGEPIGTIGSRAQTR